MCVIGWLKPLTICVLFCVTGELKLPWNLSCVMLCLYLVIIMALNVTVTTVIKHSQVSVRDRSLKGSGSRTENKSIWRGDGKQNSFPSRCLIRSHFNSSIVSVWGLCFLDMREIGLHLLTEAFSLVEMTWFIAEKCQPSKVAGNEDVMLQQRCVNHKFGFFYKL